MAGTEKLLANSADIDTKRRLRSSTGEVGRESLCQGQPPMEAGESFSNALVDARDHQLALVHALEHGDDARAAIAMYDAQQALVIAHRALEASRAGGAEMKARLEPVERSLNELFARVANDTPSRDRLVRTAFEQVDGDQSGKVLINVIVKAENGHVLLAVANELHARRHPIHGTYLDALVRLILLDQGVGLRDFAIARLERAGISAAPDMRVARMTTGERLTTGAKYGIPEIADETVDQLVGALWLLPVGIGIGVLITLDYLPELAAWLLMVPAAWGAIKDLNTYRVYASEARTIDDLHTAGRYFAKFAACLGLTVIPAFVAKLRAPRAAPKEAPRSNTPTSEPEPTNVGEKQAPQGKAAVPPAEELVGAVQADATPVVVTIRYTKKMARHPGHAMFFKNMIEWVQTSEQLRTASRASNDGASRKQARTTMENKGADLTDLDAAHPLDSIVNEFFDPLTRAYYFAHKSVNRSMGGQLQKLGKLPEGTPVKIIFEGFPTDIPMETPLVSE